MLQIRRRGSHRSFDCDSAGGNIGYARDFVSHGKIDRWKAKAFSAHELGHTAPKYQFDSHNDAHRQLVRKYSHRG